MVKYKANEIKQEADDLGDPADHDVDDKTHEMRKVISLTTSRIIEHTNQNIFQLLRRFHDLMLINVLDKDEDCPVCLETLTSKNCSRYGYHSSSHFND
jgi:hypothetical protein